ncbi:hypothetical protein PLICRDRAFT_175060 [Plicaturopsis crispa FD-325 SS-3]|nr:hypothetical protein PLICRDRAFT_175060 [Plicaturopsis crispa FD-325 SS-3]
MPTLPACAFCPPTPTPLPSAHTPMCTTPVCTFCAQAALAHAQTAHAHAIIVRAHARALHPRMRVFKPTPPTHKPSTHVTVPPSRAPRELVHARSSLSPCRRRFPPTPATAFLHHLHPPRARRLACAASPCTRDDDDETRSQPALVVVTPLTAAAAAFLPAAAAHHHRPAVSRAHLEELRGLGGTAAGARALEQTTALRRTIVDSWARHPTPPPKDCLPTATPIPARTLTMRASACTSVARVPVPAAVIATPRAPETRVPACPPSTPTPTRKIFDGRALACSRHTSPHAYSRPTGKGRLAHAVSRAREMTTTR